MVPLKRVLVFEPQRGGHRSNFLAWLQQAAPGYPECRLVFFTAEDAGDALEGKTGRWERQWAIDRLFREACRLHAPDHVLVLELTPLELPLVLWGSPVPISAILFVQYPELPRGLKYWVKHFKTMLLLFRAPVQNIFLLNGERSQTFLANAFGQRCRFLAIADPPPNIEANPDYRLREQVGVAEDKRICLFFGSVSERKGAGVLLQALARVSGAVAENSVFFFVGEPEPDYRDSFSKKCRWLRENRPDVTLIVEDQFIPDSQMIALFEQSDLILMPYCRPEYSSGILALAAKAGTPVLGPEGGLLGRLIVENGLGAVSKVDEDALAKSLEKHVVVAHDLLQKFVENNRIDQFSKPILDAICCES